MSKYLEKVEEFYKREQVEPLCYGGEELGFSSYRCECCGGLAGDRFTAHGKHKESGDWFDFEVCVDCIDFVANGDLPEED